METKVWLLTTGTGQDGDEWSVEGIYSTKEKAELAKKRFQVPPNSVDGYEYVDDYEVEEWDVD